MQSPGLVSIDVQADRRGPGRTSRSSSEESPPASIPARGHARSNLARVPAMLTFFDRDARHSMRAFLRIGGPVPLRAVYPRVAGANHPDSGLPTNVVIFPRTVDPSTRPTTTSFGKFTATGPLSSADAPFDPGQGGPSSDELRIAIPRDRIDDRRRL